MKKLLLFLCALFFIAGASAQNEMFKALFMYNFTKDIDWPDSYKQGDFVIGVLGNSEIIAELNKIAQKKKVGGQQIKVKKFTAVNDIEKCNILYLPENKSSQLSAALEKLTDKPTLIITDKPGLAQEGAGINYVTVDGGQKFEINRNNIQARGLKINSFLLSLGIVVD